MQNVLTCTCPTSSVPIGTQLTKLNLKPILTLLYTTQLQVVSFCEYCMVNLAAACLGISYSPREADRVTDELHLLVPCPTLLVLARYCYSHANLCRSCASHRMLTELVLG